MRGGQRARRAEEEEESVFISMTDLTVSFLFIVMILLAFFATQIAPKGTVPLDEYERVSKALAERDIQIASLLQELETYRKNGDQAVPWLQSENLRLSAQVRELELEAERVRVALSIPLAQDAVKEITRLRDEIARLHRLIQAATKINPIERYNYQTAEQRGKLLDRIRARITSADQTIEVDISRNRDALEFKGDGLFESGKNTPAATGRHKMELIAGVLREELGCFVLGERSALSQTCNPVIAMIDALQVEGHTDSDGGDAHNMSLGSQRGASVYGIMTEAAPDVLSFKNLRGQPILSVASYGEGRPIRGNDSKEGKDANRRIDLRFIMFSPTEEQYVPQRVEDLSHLQQLLMLGGQP